MHPELRDLVQEAFAKTDEAPMQAKAWLIQRLLTDAALFQAHIQPIVEQIVDQLIRELLGEQRRHMRQFDAEVQRRRPAPVGATVGPPTHETPPHRLLRLGRERLARQSWMAYPLMSGKKVLGEMVRPELQKASEWYLSAGQTNLITGHWLERIANVLTDDETPVRAVLNEQTLQRLREESIAAVA